MEEIIDIVRDGKNKTAIWIGSDDFYRLRIGIGKPKHNDLALFVTTPFTKDEMITLSSVFALCKAMLDTPEKECEKSVLN